MQLKLKFSLALFLVSCLIGLSASAQDEGQSGAEIQELNQHPELNLNDDKTLLMDADAKAKNQAASKDNNAPINGVKNKQENQSKPSAEKAEEDPLSFNFLYFIIQKFKISDIVDD